PPDRTAGTGGPDGFGHRWADSDAPGGPRFDWVDIASTGVPIPFTQDDQNLGPFPIGFDFEFFGTRHSQIRVCSNGWLSFISRLTAFVNHRLPAGSPVPSNLIAPFWDDLNFANGGGHAYYQASPSRFVVEFAGVPRNTTDGSPGGNYTFEVVLDPTGAIRFQYQTMSGPTSSCTIGIQNLSRDDGLTVAYNQPYLHDDMV